MSKLDKIDGGYIFFCPACKEGHFFDSRWTFDGNMEAPTFTPSLRLGPYWRMPPGWDYEKAERDANGELVRRADGRLVGAVEWQCHLNLTSGTITFHGDCTHEFAGKTVPMEEM